MNTIRIAGVPEHYNLPFYQLSEEQPFLQKGIQIDWQTYSTGTGHMLEDLQNGKLDGAIVLTEGALTHQASGHPTKIIAHYVKSPLIWGVHAHVNHSAAAFPTHNKTVFGISRYTSGSHLMAHLYAQRKGIELSKHQFKLVNNLSGAISALEAGQVDLFLWEKYTTKPTVDAGILQCMDEFHTPWEPFVLVSSESKQKELREVWNEIIDWVSIRTKKLRLTEYQEKTLQEVVNRFGLRYEDAFAWFERLEWDVRPVLEPASFDGIRSQLVQAGIVEPKMAEV